MPADDRREVPLPGLDEYLDDQHAALAEADAYEAEQRKQWAARYGEVIRAGLDLGADADTLVHAVMEVHDRAQRERKFNHASLYAASTALGKQNRELREEINKLTDKNVLEIWERAGFNAVLSWKNRAEPAEAAVGRVTAALDRLQQETPSYPLAVLRAALDGQQPPAPMEWLAAQRRPAS